MTDTPQAKLRWRDPTTLAVHEVLLYAGSSISIGRSSTNEVMIAEQHVSRQHALITYTDGLFVIKDMGSANGTFVNDARVEDPFPLFHGDTIRLFVPTLEFLAMLEDGEEAAFIADESLLDVAQATLTVTNGPQEGQVIPILLPQVHVGRATANATWEILLQDISISRPHARIERQARQWFIYDLGSSNGTFVNDETVTDAGHPLQDGDELRLGQSKLVFRLGGGVTSRLAP